MSGPTGRVGAPVRAAASERSHGRTGRSTSQRAVPRPRLRRSVARVLAERARLGTIDERQGIAGALGASGGAVALEALGPLLEDPSDRVRRAALLALGRSGHRSPSRRARVRGFLSDPAPRVRAAAAVLLGRWHDRASVPALMGRLEAPGTWEKPSVAIALGRIGDRRAVAPLCRLAASPESWLRVCAVHALGEIGAPAARATVRRALVDPAWSVRGAAAAALGRLGEERDLPSLLAALADAHPWPRRGAIVALGQLDRRETAPKLRASLEDPAAEVRLAACWALATLGDRAARGPIARLLSESRAPSAGEGEVEPSTGAQLPGRNAEAYVFEGAVAALAALAGHGAGSTEREVRRHLREAERRLARGCEERTVAPALVPASLGRAPATLGALLKTARGGGVAVNA